MQTNISDTQHLKLEQKNFSFEIQFPQQKSLLSTVDSRATVTPNGLLVPSQLSVPPGFPQQVSGPEFLHEHGSLQDNQV